MMCCVQRDKVSLLSSSLSLMMRRFCLLSLMFVIPFLLSLWYGMRQQSKGMVRLSM